MTRWIARVVFLLFVLVACYGIYADQKVSSNKQKIGADVAQKGVLTVKITGVSKKEGQLLIGLFKDQKDFLKKAYKGAKLSVGEFGSVVTFTDLPYGVYALSVVHDVNSNDKMDFFTVFPTEPYGLSNNVRPMGMPSFDQCQFNVDKPSQTIQIEVK